MSQSKKTVSGRMDSVQTPVIPVVADLIAQNPDTISLGQGVVYYGPPRPALQHLQQLHTTDGVHKYGETGGLLPLRAMIGAKLLDENNIDINKGYRVIVTAGSNMAFLNALFAITRPGDEIILTIPYYFNHEMAIQMLSCKPIPVSCDENYYPCPDEIRAAITPRTRAVVTISPNNPSGAVYPESLLTRINDLCREHGIYHINDEAYEYFTYNGARHFSPGGIDNANEHTISLYSLSKAYGFANWRIGYMVIPERLLEAVYKAQDTNLICPSIASQYAAMGALETGRRYCRENLGVIEEVRAIMLSSLEGIKSFCQVSKSEGAFYFLVKIDTEIDDMTLVERLIREHKVAVLPGNTFGLQGGGGFRQRSGEPLPRRTGSPRRANPGLASEAGQRSAASYLRVAYGALDKQNAAEGIQRLVNGLNDIVC